MNICIVGNNLTSLIVSKILINNGAKIDFLSSRFNKYHLSYRTIGISKSNIDFINNEICSLKDLKFKKINKIKIYSDNKKEILEFQDNKFLFSVFKSNDLFFRPPLCSECNYDIIKGTNESNTCLQYSLDPECMVMNLYLVLTNQPSIFHHLADKLLRLDCPIACIHPAFV